MRRCWVLVRSQQFVVAHFWHHSSWVCSVDCHVSITLQSFLPGLVWSSLDLSSACLIPSPINAFLLPSHHVPFSTSPNCFVGYKLYPYDVKCITPATSGYVNVSYIRSIASTKFTVSDFHTLYCMHQITVWNHRLTPLDHQQCGMRTWAPAHGHGLSEDRSHSPN